MLSVLGFHILIQRFNSCLSAPEEGFLFFPVGGIKRDRTALADVKLKFSLFDIISFFSPLLDIDKDHVYK